MCWVAFQNFSRATNGFHAYAQTVFILWFCFLTVIPVQYLDKTGAAWPRHSRNIGVRNVDVQVHTQVCSHVCSHVYSHTHVCTHACTCACIHVCARAIMRVRNNVHTHTQVRGSASSDGYRTTGNQCSRAAKLHKLLGITSETNSAHAQVHGSAVPLEHQFQRTTRMSQWPRDR